MWWGNCWVGIGWGRWGGGGGSNGGGIGDGKMGGVGVGWAVGGGMVLFDVWLGLGLWGCCGWGWFLKEIAEVVRKGIEAAFETKSCSGKWVGKGSGVGSTKGGCGTRLCRQGFGNFFLASGFGEIAIKGKLAVGLVGLWGG